MIDLTQFPETTGVVHPHLPERVLVPCPLCNGVSIHGDALLDEGDYGVRHCHNCRGSYRITHVRPLEEESEFDPELYSKERVKQLTRR